MQVGLPSGTLEALEALLGWLLQMLFSWLEEASSLPSLWQAFQSIFLALQLHALSYPGRPEPEFTWIKNNLAKRGVNYYRHLEFGLPGTKQQIPALLGLWMILNIQSTTAEIRWCFCSICRKHTGSDAANIKITVPFQEIWLGIFPGHKCYLKNRQIGKRKRPKYYRN